MNRIVYNHLPFFFLLNKAVRGLIKKLLDWSLYFDEQQIFQKIFICVVVISWLPIAFKAFFCSFNLEILHRTWKHVSVDRHNFFRMASSNAHNCSLGLSWLFLVRGTDRSHMVPDQVSMGAGGVYRLYFLPNNCEPWGSCAPEIQKFSG